MHHVLTRICLVLVLMACGTAQALAGELFCPLPAARSVTLTGYTRARWTMDIVPEVSGRCLKVYADVGQAIGSDGVFARLDTTFIDLALQKNQVTRERLANNQAYYQRQVERYETLVSGESAAQAVLDEWRNHRDQAQLERESLKVEAADLTEQRERHAVRTRPGWVVTERLVEPGEWVQAGTVIGKAGDYGKLLVPFALDPAEYAWLRHHEGNVTLTFPDVNVCLPARVERISPAFDPETRKTSVDLLVTEGLPEMRGGLRAELIIDLSEDETVLVPASAVSQRYEEAFLTREDGSRLKVLVLGDGPDGQLRVRASGLTPQMRFKAQPE